MTDIFVMQEGIGNAPTSCREAARMPPRCCQGGALRTHAKCAMMPAKKESRMGEDYDSNKLSALY
jgi:hypothetical protein